MGFFFCFFLIRIQRKYIFFLSKKLKYRGVFIFSHMFICDFQDDEGHFSVLLCVYHVLAHE
jgi:hypothetical protein